PSAARARAFASQRTTSGGPFGLNGSATTGTHDREGRMSFAAGLRQALDLRQRDVDAELRQGDTLENVLDRHLLVVEKMSDREILTSVLLLSSDGKHLTHGAAPSLPKEYRDAINGSEIGPEAGSCGTAAYFGKPVYVTDIATDPLWAAYRDYALP